MEIHKLKIAPEYFDKQLNRSKNFEVRWKDRNYNVGDFLLLCEYENGEYTERKLLVAVTYILDDPQYCKEGYIIMSTKRVNISIE